MNHTVLDNPAWEALLTEQARFAVGNQDAKRYRQNVLPFTACRSPKTGSMMRLDGHIRTGEVFFIIGTLPQLPEGWVPEHELPCAQMLLEAGNAMPAIIPDRPPIVKLGEGDAPAMLALINQVQPGYFLPHTNMLGNYYGICEQGQLVAMAGERMRLTGYTELSAICTLPGYTGRGYAQNLIRRLCEDHAAAGIQSFLHVAITNQRAINLYKHMGFSFRREIVFTRLQKHA